MGALIEIKDMYKIYHPGENEVYALNGVSRSSAIPVQGNLRL